MGKQSKHFPNLLLCSPGLVLFLCQAATAARLLQVYIEQDGAVVIHSYYQDGGLADAATVWRYLQRPPIMVDDDAMAVKANAASLLKAELAGDVTMRIQHVNRIIAQARLSTLALRRHIGRRTEHLPFQRDRDFTNFSIRQAKVHQVRLAVAVDENVARLSNRGV